jgi:hypothetical protein
MSFNEHFSRRQHNARFNTSPAAIDFALSKLAALLPGRFGMMKLARLR